ncbi:MAG: hypothetical protein RhofKO_17060 [Rhodothermales bacterium]
MRTLLLLGLCFSFTFVLYGQPTNNTPGTATEVTTLPFTDADVSFSTATNSGSYPSSTDEGCTFSRDVFYRFTAISTGTLTVEVANPGAAPNPRFLLFYKSDDATFTPAEAAAVSMADGNENTCNARSESTINTEAGATYYVLIVNNSSFSGGKDSDVLFTGTTTLPVELTGFSATADGDRAHLAWQTASETNNAGFQIEHQPTGTAAWHTLGFTPGHGTTLEAQRYTYTADGLTPGTHRFRLTQVDYDGTFDYSPEIEVSIEIAGAFNLSQVYPNPFNPEASVTLSVRERQQVRVTVYDLLGREVARLFDGELASQKGQLLRLDGSQWTSGLYVVRAVGERFTATQVVTLLK